MSVLAVTLFGFSDSPVGPYHERVLSLFVAPRIGASERHPHAAVSPIRIASTHDDARWHAIDLWHLPHRFADGLDLSQIEPTPLCDSSYRICQANKSRFRA
jgi:hypothetical protein